MILTLLEAARIAGAKLVGPGGSQPIGRAVIDSRRASEGDLFFALRGQTLDGHDYVSDAFRNGASAAVVGREVAQSGGTQIVVSDPEAALVALAGWVRDVVDPLVVAITGSTGKTGVKDLLASIVSRQRKTVSSWGSFNNELGLPLTLLQTRVDTEVVICEMGARGIGHIAALSELARPQIGVVTNVGVTHFEQFGSQQAIAEAKAELVASLPEGGAAILNADDPLVLEMQSRTRAEVLTFGLTESAWLRASDVRFDDLARPTFRLRRGGSAVSVTMGVSGRHQVSNALAAGAAALAIGLTLDDCRVGLESARLSPWRMQIENAGGVVLVNDAYNANPASAASALSSCAEMAESRGRLIAVLGYMAELGDIEVSEHRRVGALAASVADRLIVVGGRAAPIGRGARDAGMTDVREVADGQAALGELGDLKAGDVVLIKGSRVARLETIVEGARKLVSAG
jgi:UDP-N-acetylmuramoyl-tripeptide--D-alanyl-D-alanine ligase